MREKELLAIKRVLPFLRERERERNGWRQYAGGRTDGPTDRKLYTNADGHKYEGDKCRKGIIV